METHSAPSALFLLLAVSSFLLTASSPQCSQLQSYIIRMRLPRNATLVSAQALDDWYRSLLPPTAANSTDPRILYTYSAAMTGFAARLTEEELRSVERKPASQWHNRRRHPIPPALSSHRHLFVVGPDPLSSSHLLTRVPLRATVTGSALYATTIGQSLCATTAKMFLCDSFLVSAVSNISATTRRLCQKSSTVATALLHTPSLLHRAFSIEPSLLITGLPYCYT
ncbi:hypothetical protein ZIOFF_062494 [Zingiber officinale]|uniref:Inhibitor I9 domain-containing protein n=1 Tax=Zingiber officinale TaxID=94328 RepID=A0A8J5KFE5_ZINOF|nr:hypothetical protein ZIOFF_062494 [Zingiber officinale]